jgi:hypothetical protein
VKVPKLLQSVILRTVTTHTAQAIGGALTASAVDLPALSEGQLSIESYSLLTAGVLVQTGVALFDAMRKRIKQRKLERATAAAATGGLSSLGSKPAP